MSTYWGYACRTCGTESDHWFNHGEEALAQFYRLHQLIKQVGVRTEWLTLSVMGGEWATHEMQEFLTDHEGHEIELRNEYGKTRPISDEPHAAATPPDTS